MENENKINPPRPSVHKILAHSYSVFFILFLISLCLDLFFPLKFFGNLTVVYLGFVFLACGTFLIFWAQKTSRHLDIENLTKETFCHGPYRYTRSPTHWGLFLLMLGAGMINDALFIVLFSFVAFLVTKFVFLRKEEEVLEGKYGAPYREYKQAVKL